MLDLIIRYATFGVAILIPVALLAAIAWVLIHPVSFDDVDAEDEHEGDKDAAEDRREGQVAKELSDAAGQ